MKPRLQLATELRALRATFPLVARECYRMNGRRLKPRQVSFLGFDSSIVWVMQFGKVHGIDATYWNQIAMVNQ